MNNYNRMIVDEYCKLRGLTPGMKKFLIDNLYDKHTWDELNNSELFTIVFEATEINGVKLVDVT